MSKGAPAHISPPAGKNNQDFFKAGSNAKVIARPSQPRVCQLVRAQGCGSGPCVRLRRKGRHIRQRQSKMATGWSRSRLELVPGSTQQVEQADRYLLSFNKPAPGMSVRRCGAINLATFLSPAKCANRPETHGWADRLPMPSWNPVQAVTTHMPGVYCVGTYIDNQGGRISPAC